MKISSVIKKKYKKVQKANARERVTTTPPLTAIVRPRTSNQQLGGDLCTNKGYTRLV